MIAVDWGGTSARASLLDEHGESVNTVSAALGVKSIPKNGFDRALQQLCGNWLHTYPQLPVIAAGMIGSNGGWREAPYVACPANLSALARAIVTVERFDGSLMHIVPGVRCLSPQGLPDVMRGEETQVFGVLSTENVESRAFILPGTHSKWVWTEKREIAWLTTFMTGELFDILEKQSLLGQFMREDGASAANPDSPAFLEGLDQAFASYQEGAGMFSRLFSVRTRALIDGLRGNASREYMSGLLIGSEVAEGASLVARRGIPLHDLMLVGEPVLCELYRAALIRRDISCRIYAQSAAVQGLWAIANQSTILERSSHA
jgi:2-dehydro-3-deoxygalactonokinase